jgi:nickel-dependent lactate racemase
MRPMGITIDYGRQKLELTPGPGQNIVLVHGPAALADLGEVVRASLEAPFNYPPLRRALTPEDHVVILVDEQLPNLAALLVPVLEHVASAGVEPEAITLLCPTATGSPGWIDQLPDEFDGVRVEVHDPADRRRLSYLATTGAGRRLYLNRSIIDADQVVVLTGRHYDPYLGRGGAEGAIYPALADEATRDEVLRHPRFDAPGQKHWALFEEAIEVTWLLGQPFFVQAVAAAGDGIAQVIAGAGDACREGDRLLDVAWRQHIAARPGVVVAALSGDPSRHTFADLAAALANAARVVQSGGRIILLTDAPPVLGPGAEILCKADEPGTALAALEKSGLRDATAALQWAWSASLAHVSILGNFPDDTVEDLFASPLAGPVQVQRLLAGPGARGCLILQDAQRMMAVVE